MSRYDPDGNRLPIRIDETSNGEFEPAPLDLWSIAANAHAQEQASDAARRLGRSRRAFMVSLCGAASTLLAFNRVNAASGKTGGAFQLPAEAAFDEDAAHAFLGGQEFIFDVQGHYVNPNGAWLSAASPDARPFAGMQNTCVLEKGVATREYLACLGPEEFIKDVFLDSDTDMMVLSFVPSSRESEPLTIEEADATRRIIDAMDGDHRMLLHGRVNPNQPGDLEDMQRLAANFPISAWKTYTQWGPEGRGFSLTDDVGEALIAAAKRTGIRNIAIHKGLAFGPQSYEHSLCTDVGPAAKRHPRVNFIIYHAGYDMHTPERAFTPGAGAAAGVDVLCQSLLDAGVAPNANVYAELGSTWRFLMRDPDQAAHLLGKLITYCGQNNVLWGTDSIWYGSPQDQIQAFRAFQISPEFQERFAYSALTPEIKAKIFGLNALKPYAISKDEALRRASNDALTKRRHGYLEQPDPSFATYGPKTRREFVAFQRLKGTGP